MHMYERTEDMRAPGMKNIYKKTSAMDLIKREYDFEYSMINKETEQLVRDIVYVTQRYWEI